MMFLLRIMQPYSLMQHNSLMQHIFGFVILLQKQFAAEHHVVPHFITWFSFSNSSIVFNIEISFGSQNNLNPFNVI